MNENDLNREERISRKLLNFLDKEIEKFLSQERLTGADLDEANAAVSPNYELFLQLSRERRAVLRRLSKLEKLKSN